MWMSEQMHTLLWRDACYLNKSPTMICLAKKKKKKKKKKGRKKEDTSENLCSLTQSVQAHSCAQLKLFLSILFLNNPKAVSY